MDRARTLATALEYISKDRHATHGAAEDSFSVIADLWSAYLRGIFKARHGDLTLRPHDVAALMVLFKMARVTGNPQHEDNWIDSAGYSALGSEMAVPDPEGPTEDAGPQ